MAIITGFVEPIKDYAVFVIVIGLGGIPLVIEKSNFSKKMWKLPGGKPNPEDDMDKDITAMRKINDEIGVVVEYPEKEFFRIPKPRHDFIVLKAKYFSGDFIAKAEIERVGLFTLFEIRQMIEEKQILPDHAEALLKHIGEVKALHQAKTFNL